MRNRSRSRDRQPAIALLRAGLPLLVLALLPACGDDLESRNAATAGYDPAAARAEAAPQARQQDRPQVRRGQGGDGATAGEGFDEEQPLEVDADAESLMDSAQGFAATPVDAAAGFDPTPQREPAFGAAPAEPENFAD